MTNTTPTTIAQELPPKWRRRVYAGLACVVPTVITVVAVVTDGWQWSDLGLILPSAAATAGFGLAIPNTPA